MISMIKKYKIYDNTAIIQENIENFYSFKSSLIKFLNKNPLVSYNKFKHKEIKLYLKISYSFAIKKLLCRIYIIHGELILKYLAGSIFDNINTSDNKFFLRDVSYSLCYDAIKKQYFWYRYAWMLPFFIKVIHEAEHFFFDSSFITTKDFYQIFIIRAYYIKLDTKVPICFILMNNKSQTPYEIV